MPAAHVLIIDDDTSIIRAFSAYLEKHGYIAHGAGSFHAAFDILSKNRIDVIFADILLGEDSGIDILKEIKTRGLKSPVIMITGKPDIETASASVRLGAFDYITKPVDKDTFIRVTKNAIQHKAFLDEHTVIERENESRRSHMEAFFMSVDVGIVTVDNDMRIIRANEALARTCRLSSIAGSRVSEVENKCSLKCWAVFEEALKEKDFTGDHRIQCEHAASPSQVVRVTVTPLKDRQGGYIGGAMVVRDINRELEHGEGSKDRKTYGGMVGSNGRMQEIYSLIDSLKGMDTTVLVTGPSGTGKDLVARALHYTGTRADKPFVTVNCSALAENLLESELFGHVKGAFTNALKDKTGRFELANHGTIFLDEIGDISPSVQLKLLRVLETKEFERVGDSAPMRADVRIVTATNKDLKSRVREGKFREDLYYRLKVVEINVPALKERPDDLPLLVEHYISVFNERFKKNVRALSREADSILLSYEWPGNVRELVHVLEHAFVLCKEPVIGMEHLPREIREQGAESTCLSKQSPRTSHGIMKEDVIEALEKSGWNKALASRILGISRPHLYKKMKDYNINNQNGQV